MMVRRFSGRCALRVEAAFAAACIWLTAGSAAAAPAGDFDESLADALAAAESAWAESLLSEGREMGPYDEQIFTEISPILDSPEGVKLPEDQNLSD